MKKQLLVVFTFFTAFFSYAQTPKSDLAINNLKGKVKSVNETNYEATEKFGELEKGTKVSHHYREFNPAGFELQFVLEYFDEDEKDKFVRTTRYENDKAVEMKEDDNGEVATSRLKYNTQGLPESIDGLDRKGNLLFRQKNKHNAEGLLIQADSYKGDGSPEIKSVSSYNAKKQLVKEERYNSQGKLTSLDTYTYDSRGNLVEKSSVDYETKDPKPYVYKYAYNEAGLKIEERNSIAGLDRKKIFEYNSRGDEIRILDQYGDEEKKVYTYDGQNNWTKCVTTKTSNGNKKHEVSERQIRYY